MVTAQSGNTAPPLPFFHPLARAWPGWWRRRDSVVPTDVGAAPPGDYKQWPVRAFGTRSHQSLRLRNQSISGDSKDPLASFRLTRFRLWFGMETSLFTRSRRSSMAHDFKSKYFCNLLIFLRLYCIANFSCTKYLISYCILSKFQKLL